MNAPGATGRRILAVDDELQILRALKATLRSHGYEVVTAATMEEGLDAAALTPVDVAIVDLLLPDGDGIELARRLREWSSMAATTEKRRCTATVNSASPPATDETTTADQREHDRDVDRPAPAPPQRPHAISPATRSAKTSASGRLFSLSRRWRTRTRRRAGR